MPQPSTEPLISLRSCSLILDGKAVLDDLTFTLRRGDRWAIVGANGAGKTLFLKLLRGDMWPTPTGRESRRYCFDGDIEEQPFGAKERIAYVGPERQDKYVRYDWNHSVAAVVTTGLFDEEIPRTRPTPAQQRRVATLLKRFRLWGLRQRGFLTLSYGQRRRALVARALASNPLVLLLDEVFNGLDATSRRVLREALRNSRSFATWIATAHRGDDVPTGVTRVARIEAGKLSVLSRAEFAASWRRKVAAAPAPKRAAGRRRIRSRALITLHNVNLYRDYRPVLRDVDWTIQQGEHWAILGRNGSGKSTLLRALYGDLHPRLGGTIERDGVPFGTPIIEWKRRVGFVSPELQSDYFLARDLEEVAMSGRYSSVGLNDAPTASDRRHARRWLKFFGIESIAHRGPRAVSYGQMRLALLARAMVGNPELLLLDEPCTGLAPAMRATVIQLLEELASCGVQLVIAVHHRDDLPKCVTNELRIGAKGRVILRSGWRVAGGG